MITEDTLIAAVSAGLISNEQASALRALEATRSDAQEEPVDEERLRFVTGFADIFVAIGLCLFLGAASYFLFQVGDVVAHVGVTVGSWALAEFFTRRKRMALPSILLLVGFVGGVFASTVALLDFLKLLTTIETASIVAGPAAALAAWAHYRRFSVPITPAAGAAALVSMLVGALYVAWPDGAPVVFPVLLAVCGLVLFAQGLRLDRSDPGRETRRTDIAFWLHLLAGPLIVHPVMFYSGAWNEDGAPAVTIALFLFLALVALAADRRAILVSSLIYTGVAIGYLARARGMEAGATTAFSMFVLGAVILGLSAGWKPIRGVVMGLLPRRWAAYFPI